MTSGITFANLSFHSCQDLHTDPYLRPLSSNSIAMTSGITFVNLSFHSCQDLHTDPYLPDPAIL